MSDIRKTLPGRRQPHMRFDVFLTALYASLIGFLTFRHQMWPDEAQQWLIARGSHGLGQLFHNRRYEGHPLPWYLILYPFAHLSANVEAIKPINWALSVAAAYLTIHNFLKGRVEKILFLLAPLPIFYFSVVSRPYMLGYLLVVLVCLALRQPRRMLTIFLLLGLLANIHTYFLLLAAVFLLYYLLLLGLPRTLRQMPPRFWGGLVLCLCLFALCIWQVVPPPDYGSKLAHERSFGAASALFALAMGPYLGADTNFGVFLVLLAPFAGLVFLAVRDTPRIAVFLVTGSLGLLAFETLAYGGSVWHAGLIYVCVLAAIFLMRDRGIPPADAAKFDYTVLAMFGLHALSGLLLLRTVMATPCSNAKYVAAFVESYCPQGCTLVGDKAFWGGGVSAYLGGQALYYVDRQAFGTFIILDTHNDLPHGIDQVVEAGQRFDRPIMLVSHPATPDEAQRFHLKLLRSFSGSMVPGEQYYIYVFDNPEKAAQ